MRPKALDLFCGAGGASMGLARAGFEVTGVDVVGQPRYPFRFIQEDALKVLIKGFDFIWASPPCQAYSLAANNGSGKGAPRLISKVRARLKDSGAIFVIENVPGAPLKSPFLLCGASFGLGAIGFDLSRHRIFESNHPFTPPLCSHRPGRTIGIYGGGMNSWHREKVGRLLTEQEKRDAMGIGWMRRSELTQAVPPAYSEWIGRQILRNERRKS